MKKMVVLAVILCFSLLLGGCSAVDDAIDSVMSGLNSTSSGTPGASTLDDGRETGGYVDGRMGDTLTNVFFSYCVDEAWLAESYEGQSPNDEDTVYLVAEITVKNIFGEELEMWSDDFQVQWSGDADSYGFPIPAFSDKQMSDEYTLKKGESLTAQCVYEVPRPEKENEYSISYLEYYEDDVEGNVFFVFFDLKPEFDA